MYIYPYMYIHDYTHICVYIYIYGTQLMHTQCHHHSPSSNPFTILAQETMNQALKEGWKSDSLSHMQVPYVSRGERQAVLNQWEQ